MSATIPVGSAPVAPTASAPPSDPAAAYAEACAGYRTLMMGLLCGSAPAPGMHYQEPMPAPPPGAPAPAPAGQMAPTPATEPAPAPAPPPPMGDVEALSIMQANREYLPDTAKNEDFAALAADESKPIEVRMAAQYMVDHGMVERMGHQDGDISGKDWDNIGKIPELVDFNRANARTYTENYIPSDAVEGDTLPRPITESDANRELYLYSASLPKDVGKQELQDIVDGKCPEKNTPQLRAAAQFMLDHPDSWQKICPNPDGRVNRGDLQQRTSENINLTEAEVGTIRVLQQNKDLFLSGDDYLTRESLTKLAADESAPPEVRQAAQKLLDDPVIFGMLDNAHTGHRNKKADVNDGKIGLKDINEIDTRLTSTNLTPPGKPVGQHAPTNAREKAAMDAMIAGAANDPDIKPVEKKKRSPWAKVLDVVGKVLDVVKMAVDVVSGFLPPPFSAIGVAIGAGIATVNNFAIKAPAAMLNGASADDAYKEAGKNQAIDMAGSAVSLIPGGGAAKAGMAAAKGGMALAKVGAKEGAEAGAKTAVREGTEVAAKVGAAEGAEAGAKTGAKEGAEAGTKEGAEAGAKEGAETGAKEGGEEGAKKTTREKVKEVAIEVRDTVVDEAKGEAEARAQAEAEARARQLLEKRRGNQPEVETHATA